MSEILGGVKAFEGARPDDGVLEIGVVTAQESPPVDPDARKSCAGQDRKVALHSHDKGEEVQDSFRASFSVRTRRRFTT
jgi:hypothetical protein